MSSDTRRFRRHILFAGLMLVSAAGPYWAWEQGRAYIADVGDPMIHLACQGLAAWGVLREQAWGVMIYGLLALFSFVDLVYALFGSANVPASQTVGTLALIATAIYGAVLVLPDLD